MARDIVGWLLSRIKVNAAGCFEWQGALNHRGYGKTRWKGKNTGIHRMSFEVFRREVPDGLFVCHKCDNPRCINPAHLFLGTAADNSEDMVRKNRSNYGVRQHDAKLDDAKVLEVVKRYNAGEQPKQLAAEFGISTTSIKYLLNGTTWKRVVRPDRVYRSKFGEGRHTSKLKNEQVVAIKLAVESGQRQKDIADRFGINQSQVSRIVSGKRWSHMLSGAETAPQ